MEIDKEDFVNRLHDIYDILKENGYDVYYPSQKAIECKRPYVVVKYDGAMSSLVVSSDMPIFEVMCYVPFNQYSSLIPYVFEVKQTLKKLYPKVWYAGNETGSYYDEEAKAWMVSFMYQTVRKIELT